jgi:hypothetical protein
MNRGRRFVLTLTGLAVNSLDVHQGRVDSPKVLTNCTVPNDSVNDLFPALRYIVIRALFYRGFFMLARHLVLKSNQTQHLQLTHIQYRLIQVTCLIIFATELNSLLLFPKMRLTLYWNLQVMYLTQNQIHSSLGMNIFLN